MSAEARRAGPGGPGGPGGAGFWISAAVGWAIMAFAVRGLLAEPDWAANPDGFARFLLSAAVLHDLLLAPAVVAVGVAVARWVPAPLRAPVQGGLVASAVVCLVAWPFLRGYGVAATNPSVLPWNYARSLAVLLAAIWVVTALAAALRLRSLSRHPR